MAAEADAEPAVRVERVRRLERTANDRGQRAADLRRRHAFGQRASQRDLRQQVERAAAIGDRSADRREAAVGRDRAAPAPRRSAVARASRARPSPSTPATRRCTRRARRAASDGSRSCCSSPSGTRGRRRTRRRPCTTARAGGARSRRAVRSQEAPSALQPGFDRRREQQPVVEARHDRARRFERGDQLPFRRRVERVAQRARRAQQALREERRVDQRLAIAREVQKSGEAGSTARAIARRARSAYAARGPPLGACRPAPARSTVRCPPAIDRAPRDV